MHPQAPPPPAVTPGSNSSTSQGNSGHTLAEREARYQAARERIFGGDDGSASNVNDSGGKPKRGGATSPPTPTGNVFYGNLSVPRRITRRMVWRDKHPKGSSEGAPRDLHVLNLVPQTRDQLESLLGELTTRPLSMTIMGVIDCCTSELYYVSDT